MKLIVPGKPLPAESIHQVIGGNAATFRLPAARAATLDAVSRMMRMRSNAQTELFLRLQSVRDARTEPVRKALKARSERVMEMHKRLAAAKEASAIKNGHRGGHLE